MVNELYLHLWEYFQYYSEITHVNIIFSSHFQKNHENISHKPSPSSMRCLYKIFFQNDLKIYICLLYTSPSPRDRTRSRMPSSA